MTTTKKAQGGSQGKGRRGPVDADDAARRREAARLLDAAVSTHGTPDFITDAIVTAVNVACSDNGLKPPAWLTEPHGDNQGDSLAELWERLPRMYDLNLEPKKDLAGLISAVLKHPDTPADLYSAMRRELARLTEAGDVNEHPDVIAVALAVHKAEEKGGAGE
ncbi:MAG: hypothetical protein ABW208_08865 [Pyrinomonadaceae bacterium]